MKLTILGMNGPFPAPGGNTSGYLLEHDGTRIQLDLGTGTLSTLTALCAPEELDALVLSHWHNDHCSDLLPLLYRLQAHAQKPLNVYGPEDPASPIRRMLANESCIQLHTIAPGDRVCIGSLTLTVGNARHPVPAVLERWDCGTASLVYTGDTNTVDGVTEFCRDTDLLLADGLFPTALWSEAKPHLSGALCASLANDCHAGELIITHLNPDLDANVILREAQALRPDARLAVPGITWSK